MAGQAALSIRPVRASELPALLDLYARALGASPTSLPVARRMLRRIRSYPSYDVYVALAGGAVAGTFSLIIMDNLTKNGTPTALVENVAVDPARQGRGVGKAMMRWAMEKARREGCSKLALSSNSRRKAAHAFYRALGFEPHGVSFCVPLEASEFPGFRRERSTMERPPSAS